MDHLVATPGLLPPNLRVPLKRPSHSAVSCLSAGRRSCCPGRTWSYPGGPCTSSMRGSSTPRLSTSASTGSPSKSLPQPCHSHGVIYGPMLCVRVRQGWGVAFPVSAPGWLNAPSPLPSPLPTGTFLDHQGALCKKILAQLCLNELVFIACFPVCGIHYSRKAKLILIVTRTPFISHPTPNPPPPPPTALHTAFIMQCLYLINSSKITTLVDCDLSPDCVVGLYVTHTPPSSTGRWVLLCPQPPRQLYVLCSSLHFVLNIRIKKT